MEYIEPYKIKMIERIEKSTREERILWSNEANYNLYNLRGNQVYIDLLSDSGTGAMSNYQWSEMMLGDECYAGESSYYFLKDIIEKVMMCKYYLPTHQGRAAENVLYSAMINKGDIIPGNLHYNTTCSHIKINGGIPVNCIVDSALDLKNNNLFKGNIDLNKLQVLIKNHKNKIPFVLLTITCNTLGCHPVSIKNIKEASEICRKNNIPLFFDASRFAENAYLIKIREQTHHDNNIQDIVKEMFSYVDGFVMSAKKDCLCTIGGIVGLKDEKIFRKAKNYCLLYEGYYTHGGMSSRDIRALGQGIKEVLDFEFLDSRVKQVISLGKEIKALEIPVVEPLGGHAIYIDAANFYKNISIKEYPAHILAYELYIESGIRGNASNISIEVENTNNSIQNFNQYSLFRLSIPRRTYTNNHMRYVVENLHKIWLRKNEKNKGLFQKDCKERFLDINNYTIEFNKGV